MSTELSFVVPPDPTLQVSTASVMGVATVTATVANGPGNRFDWVGLYATGAANNAHLQRKYLNGLATPPATGVTGAAVNFTMPATAGTYEFRFFTNDTFTLLATSPTVTVMTASSITAPANGATAFDTTNNIVWTAVAGAQAYYLRVGTTAGAENVINSGEIVATQHSAATLPPNTQLYATLSTKLNNTWVSTTSSFRTSPHPRWITPTAGAVGVTTAQAFSWTAVPGATAYYVWVGTTSNSSNIVNSGEIAVTQFTPASLPPAVTLYATIWSKVSNVWYGRQITFTSSPAASWVYPNGATTNVPVDVPIQWTAVAGAQAYYLWVGTTPDSSNLVDTGEIQATQYLASNLPAATTLYATLWTKHNNAWWPNTKTFTSSPSTRWVTPAVPGLTMLSGSTLQWAPVTGAQAYYLWVGTSLDAQNVVNTGETQATQWSTAGLPVGQLLYANLWVKHANTWWPTRTTFTIVPAAASWVSPSSATLPAGTPLSWTPVAGAQAYYLYIGTAPMTHNVVNTGEFMATTYPSGALPRGTLLYATIWTKYAGNWTYSTTTFTVP
jgi:hypothetical protein